MSAPVVVDDNEKVPKEKLSVEPSTNKSKFRLTVEPLGFLYVTARIIQSIVPPNLFLYKVCAVNYNINATLCDPRNQTILNNTELSDSIQKYVSTLNIYSTLIDNVPAVFLMLFLLKWSDIHGRKPLMIAPIVGNVICNLVDILNYYCESCPAEYLLMGTVPMGLTGGKGVFLVVVNRFLIDITTEETRTWRMGLNSGIIAVAVATANLASSYIYASGGNIAIWITTLSLYACAFIYVLFGFQDSRGLKTVTDSVAYETNLEKSKDKAESVRSCDVVKRICMDILKNLWSSFHETFKKRQGYKRGCIWILITITLILYFSNGFAVNNSIGYLFTRKVFGWDAPDWAVYKTIASSTSAIGTLIILPLLSGYFKVKDSIIVSISLLSHIGMNVVSAFSVSSLMFRLATIGSLLSLSTAVVTRSIFSKILNTDEISPIFSVLACLESLIPLIASLSFNLIYQATIGFFPGCFYLVRGIGNIIVLGFFGMLYFVKRRQSNIVEPDPPPTDMEAKL